MKKKQSQPIGSGTFWISVIALLIASASFAFVMKLRQDSIAYGNETVQNIINLGKENSDLQTCYENSIKPCNEDTLNAYYKANKLNKYAED